MAIHPLQEFPKRLRLSLNSNTSRIYGESYPRRICSCWGISFYFWLSTDFAKHLYPWTTVPAQCVLSPILVMRTGNNLIFPYTRNHETCVHSNKSDNKLMPYHAPLHAEQAHETRFLAHQEPAYGTWFEMSMIGSYAISAENLMAIEPDVAPTGSKWNAIRTADVCWRKAERSLQRLLPRLDFPEDRRSRRGLTGLRTRDYRPKLI